MFSTWRQSHTMSELDLEWLFLSFSLPPLLHSSSSPSLPPSHLPSFLLPFFPFFASLLPFLLSFPPIFSPLCLLSYSSTRSSPPLQGPILCWHEYIQEVWLVWSPERGGHSPGVMVEGKHLLSGEHANLVVGSLWRGLGREGAELGARLQVDRCLEGQKW